MRDRIVDSDVFSQQSCGLCKAHPSVRPQGDQPAQVIVELVTLGLNIEKRLNGQRSSALKTGVSVSVDLAECVGEIDTNLACSKVYD